MKKRLTALALVAASLGAGARRFREVKAPPPVPYSNWSGPYIGIGASAVGRERVAFAPPARPQKSMLASAGRHQAGARDGTRPAPAATA
jgi:hypothetical protein